MKKTICFILLVAFIITGGIVSCKQSAMEDLTIETIAMTVGYELRSDFEWTDSVDYYYNAIMQGKMSLNAAKLVENYLRQRTHPLIANRLVKLAGMVGFDLDDAGSLIGVNNVNIHLLQVAAQGFKQGLELSESNSTDIANRIVF